MQVTPPRFAVFVWRVVATHVLTYFVVGLAALILLDYRELYRDTELRFIMRSTDAPIVALGPSLQIVRGLLFGVVLWPFARRLLEPRGALALWGLLLGLAVLGTAGPAPGSLEGLVYTTVPLHVQLIGLPEVVVQTGLLAGGVVWWCWHPARWKTIAASVGVALVAVMSLLGYLAAGEAPLS
jgi:hypothetical protein